MALRTLIFLIGTLLLINMHHAAAAQRPLIGATVWCAPGEVDKPEEIDRLFRIMAEHEMRVARLQMMWNYLQRPDGTWDFTVYDLAFRAAEKYGIKLAPTLNAEAQAPYHGGVPDTEEHLTDGERYIAKVVEHYRKSPALDTWILVNEPGQPPRDNPLAIQRFRLWLRDKYRTIDALNHAWLFAAMVPDRRPYRSFDEINYDPRWFSSDQWPVPSNDWHTFWRTHVTWYLQWLAERVRRIDPDHMLHVGPQPLIRNLAGRSLDLPVWRPFLDSLGTSAYPNGNFGPMKTDQSALGFSYLMDLVSGAIEPKPAWLTETAGGYQIYFPSRPPYPSPQVIAQRVWTTIGAGADRLYFWIFNPRITSRQTGEHGMLDFQGQPSDRLKAVGEITKLINRNAQLFENARPVESPITILLSLETMTIEEHTQGYGGTQFAFPQVATLLKAPPHRSEEGHVMAVLAFYQALTEMGIPVHLKHMHDYDWQGKHARPQLAILPHVSVLTKAQADDLHAFVNNGNSLLLTDFTGFYDERWGFWPLKGFPLQDLTGGTLRELPMVEQEECHVHLTEPDVTLPSHLWVGEIANQSGEVIGSQNGRITAVRKRVGASEVTWIPSPIALAAWLGDNRPLSRLLEEVTRRFVPDLRFRFAGQQPGAVMRVLRSGDAYITVMANSGFKPKRWRLQPVTGYTPTIIWGQPASMSANRQEFSLGPMDTIVAVWKRSP